MNIYNDTIPLKVHTNRGDINIQDIVPFDKVYDAITGEEIIVQQVVQFKKDDTYQVTYTDGREDFYQAEEIIHIGGRNVNLRELLSHRVTKDNSLLNPKAPLGVIPQNVIPYDSTVKEPLRPDPYVSGALIVYGNFDTPYVNLPFFRRYDHPFLNMLIDRLGSGTQLGYQYQLHPIQDKGRNMIGFSRKELGDLITWKEFFRRPVKDFINGIPDKYLKAPENDRWQFIRGVFDTGYDERDFPDHCAVGHWCEDRLKSVQRILWSLGVLSTTRYDPSLKRGRKYRLEVLSHRDQWDKFLYQGKLYPKNQIKWRERPFRLQIKTIHWATNAVGYGLSLGQLGRLYQTSNFLPRVSI